MVGVYAMTDLSLNAQSQQRHDKGMRFAAGKVHGMALAGEHQLHVRSLFQQCMLLWCALPPTTAPQHAATAAEQSKGLNM
jgi:hypothetical protein